MLSLADAWSVAWDWLNQFFNPNQSRSLMNNVSYDGLCVIAREEACVTVAYPDGPHYAIGFGHNGSDVQASDQVTVEQAWELLKKDMVSRVDYLNRLLKVPLKQTEFDALCVLCYNKWAGAGEVVALLNKEQREDAITHWLSLRNRLNGSYSEGLERRRQREVALFEHGDYGDLSGMKVFTSSPPMVWTKVPFPLELY